MTTLGVAAVLVALPACRPRGLTAPTQISPASGSVFDVYPRKTPAVWRRVRDAATYAIEVDYIHCGGRDRWCGDDPQLAAKTYVARDIRDTTFTFDFVGAQLGRWRVWAVGADGKEGPKSVWREFRYTK